MSRASEPFYDASRKSDLKDIEQRERDPNTSEAELEKLDETKYAFRDQAHFQSVQKTREKLIDATRAGDAAGVARYSAELQKADKELGVFDARTKVV